MFTKDIASAWARFRGKDDPNSLVTSNSNAHDSNGPDLVWALKDINLEIKRGEILGIIGKNGAGKTTLLKIISRITSPTKGRINISGRTASLIEVGTGFHGELTGRENIYLNGSILGLRKHEINQRLDKIIDFSGVEKYIDTPVKRYSSGMYVRLGFSVAAHLDPDILIVDEVLAVGDAEFQKKCLGKMKDISSEGRTVLFVSHNMAVIQRICQRTLLLNNGEIIMNEETPKVIEKYLSSTLKMDDSYVDLKKTKDLYGDSYAIRFTKCWIINSEGEKTGILKYGEPFSIGLEIESEEKYQNLAIQVGINSSSGVRIFTSDSEEFDSQFDISSTSKLRVVVNYKDFSLMPGLYQLSKLLIRNGRHELTTLLDVVSFEVSAQIYNDNCPPLVNTGYIKGESYWKII